jgi:hypothetical protein
MISGTKPPKVTTDSNYVLLGSVAVAPVGVKKGVSLDHIF